MKKRILKMKSKLIKGFLGSALALAFALPSMATLTTITINAEVQDVVRLIIEKAGGDGSTTAADIVSDDTPDASPSFTYGADEVLEFGIVDPYGISEGGTGTGGYVATNAGAQTGLDKQLLVGSTIQDEATYNTSTLAATDGAIYFTEGDFQLRAFRSTLGTVAVTVAADDGTNVALDAIVAPAASNDFSATSTLNGRITANAAPVSYNPTMANNVPDVFDVGVVVPLNTTTGLKQTVITFRGS
jgi:hypothetical protein